MGKTARVPEVRAGVADLLWESGGGVRKPAAKVCRDASRRDAPRWIHRASQKSVGLFWRNHVTMGRPS